MSKIKKITVSNLKALSQMTADFNGCTAIITGGNNKGKSTFLRSFPDRLRGIKPDLVVKQGEKNGSAEMELTTGEKFIWKFDSEKDKLTYISERNIPQSVTKDLCKVYFPAVFDVDEFLNSTPKKQKETLQKLTGIDFTEIDRVYKNAYEERTFANKRVSEEKARLVLVDPNLPKEPTDITELEKEFNSIDSHNMRFDMVVRGMTEKHTAIAENDKEIEELRQKIESLEQKNYALKTDINKGETWCEEEKNKKKLNGQDLAKKIEDAKKVNEDILNNNKAADQLEKYNTMVEDAKHWDLEVKRIEAEKLDVIKNASMPDGFGFSDDGITYNGFAFDKASLSSSGIYIAALKLAAITLGEVKTLHFDASFLDKNSLCEIERWAIENDLQLLIERPDFDGGEIEYRLIQEMAVA
jgi:hypothetical protein